MMYNCRSVMVLMQYSYINSSNLVSQSDSEGINQVHLSARCCVLNYLDNTTIARPSIFPGGFMEKSQ